MKTTWEDDVMDLELGLEEVKEIAESGELKKAIKQMHKELNAYGYESIPAYLYVKYFDLFMMYIKRYELDFRIERMSVEELHERISDACMLYKRNPKTSNKAFNDKIKRSFFGYLRNQFNARELYTRISNIEKKYLEKECYSKGFAREIKTILSGFFYGRQTVKRKDIEPYEDYIRKYFSCQKFANYLFASEMDTALREEIPVAPIKCVVDIFDGEELDWFYADPTIPDVSETIKEPMSDDEKELAIFQLLFEITYKSKVGFTRNINAPSQIWQVINWYDLKYMYADLAIKYVSKGREYKFLRDEMISKVRDRINSQIAKMPESEKNKIVKITDSISNRTITVVD